ncbi:dehydrogenase [Teratosphaeria nubilosa]|uniref:aldehyde dehydrogenase (NAD(+)) n=1 Tax=Teratosphaeria nubilosa TaxID=161662 RepID=A0A6G1KYW7_9PEZI|nr:dehydrogenase [Teratosphaeria nubilosa]
MTLPTFPDLSTFTRSCKDESKRIAVENPATGETLTTIQAGDASTVDEAVKASQKAFTSRWRSLAPSERSALLFRCADALETHADELATILCLENGKPRQDARAYDVNFLVGVFRYFASICDKLPSEFYDRGSTYCTVFYEPQGVCCGILPFNWPPIHTGGRIVEILQTVLPQNVVQVVPGLGPEVPQALIEHPMVRMVSFTGSTRAGAAVAKTASASITPVVLELGGKNAYVVLEDADFDLAVRDALDGAFFNKGEACTATSRLLIHRNLYDPFVEKLAAGVKKLKAGNGMDPKTHVGPQISRAQQKRVLEFIELGKAEGARVVAQAQLSTEDECKDGFFAPATLLADVKEDMRVFKEEMFGTIVTVTPFDDFEHGFCLANNTEYGLTAAVYTKDSLQASRAVRALESGMVWVNNYNRNVLGTPFGGMKHSGYAREHTIETLKEWCSAKWTGTPG